MIRLRWRYNRLNEKDEKEVSSIARRLPESGPPRLQIPGTAQRCARDQPSSGHVAEKIGTRVQRARFARGGDADEVRHIDLGAELLQLDGADEGEDQPHQKLDQKDNGKRRCAALEHNAKEIRAAKVRPADQEIAESSQGLANEVEQRSERVPERQAVLANAREEPGPHAAVLPAGSFGRARRQSQQAAGTVGQSCRVERDLAHSCDFLDFG